MPVAASIEIPSALSRHRTGTSRRTRRATVIIPDRYVWPCCNLNFDVGRKCRPNYVRLSVFSSIRLGLENNASALADSLDDCLCENADRYTDIGGGDTGRDGRGGHRGRRCRSTRRKARCCGGGDGRGRRGNGSVEEVILCNIFPDLLGRIPSL